MNNSEFNIERISNRHELFKTSDMKYSIVQNCSIHVKSMFYIPKDRKILDLPTCALRFPQRRCADATSTRKLSDNCDNVSPMSDSSDIVRQFQFEGAVPVAGLLPCSSTHRTANRCDGFCGHHPSSLARA